MTSGKHLIALIICNGVLLAPFSVSARAETLKTCQEPKTGQSEAPIFSPPLAQVVIGAGRLQFYSAPNFHCAQEGVFIVPKDRLIAYAQTNDGWASVIYSNPRTGAEASGWVRSSRLKETGTVGPRQ
jgi:hypothetical protein